MKKSVQDGRKSSPDITWLRYPNISWIIPIVIFILVGLMWWRLRIAYQDYLFDINRSRVQNIVQGMATSLTFAINHRMALLTGLVAFVKVNAKDANLNNDFEIYASGLYANDPVIRVIEFFPVNGYELVYSSAKNDTLKGRTIDDLINYNRPTVRADAQWAIQSGGITLSSPYELLQGGKGVAVRLAVYYGSEFLGRDTTDLPRMILLDLKLPIIGGLEVLQRLRQDSRIRLVPIIILTSSSELEDIKSSYQLGANSYIRKHVDFESFADTVKQLGIYWLSINQTVAH